MRFDPQRTASRKGVEHASAANCMLAFGQAAGLEDIEERLSATLGAGADIVTGRHLKPAPPISTGDDAHEKVWSSWQPQLRYRPWRCRAALLVPWPECPRSIPRRAFPVVLCCMYHASDGV